MNLKIKYLSLFMGALLIFLIAFLQNNNSLNVKAEQFENDLFEIIYIESAIDLFLLEDLANTGKTFKLKNDIDLNADTSWHLRIEDHNKGWMPLDVTLNTGILDGCGYKIFNIYINRPELDKVGLFAQCGMNVKNLNIELIEVENGVGVFGSNIVGSLAGTMTGSAINITAKGNVSSSYLAGGLFGQAQGKIEQCYFEGSVIAECAGGLIGNFVAANIINSYAYAKVEGKIAGGFVGIAENGSNIGVITNSFAFCEMRGSKGIGLTRIGSFIGINTGGITINKCYTLIDYPSVAQGSAEGIIGLTKFEFVIKDNFNFDFKNIWYYTETSMFPRIKSLVVIINTNSKELLNNKILSGQYFYNGEEIILDFRLDGIDVSSVIINGEQNYDKIQDGFLKLFVNNNLNIEVEFKFLLEVITSIIGEGSVKTEKLFYENSEKINIIIEPSSNYKVKSLKARLNSNEIIISDKDNGTYFYQTGSEILEKDKLTIFVVFTEVGGNNKHMATWKIALIIISSLIILSGIVVFIVAIVKKKFGRNEE